MVIHKFDSECDDQLLIQVRFHHKTSFNIYRIQAKPKLDIIISWKHNLVWNFFYCIYAKCFFCRIEQHSYEMMLCKIDNIRNKTKNSKSDIVVNIKVHFYHRIAH